MQRGAWPSKARPGVGGAQRQNSVLQPSHSSHPQHHHGPSNMNIPSGYHGGSAVGPVGRSGVGASDAAKGKENNNNIQRDPSRFLYTPPQRAPGPRKNSAVEPLPPISKGRAQLTTSRNNDGLDGPSAGLPPSSSSYMSPFVADDDSDALDSDASPSSSPLGPAKKPSFYSAESFIAQGADDSIAGADVAAESGEKTGDVPNFLVVLRVRPLLPKERAAGIRDIIRVLDQRVVVVLDPGADANDFLRMNRSRERRYAFDHVFDARASQWEVWSRSVSHLIDGTLDGYNSTVFAYGATGCGKTHTMLGSAADPGIMYLTLRELFGRMRENEHNCTYRTTLSYLEVYNEVLRDLMTPGATTGADCTLVELREDPARGIRVSGLTELETNNVEHVMALLNRGNRLRTQEHTAANETSSRSHAVLQVTVEQRDKTPNSTVRVRVSKLSMIDLAGSERASVTQNRGQRMLEGQNINRSLLALGNCINALIEQKSSKSGGGTHIPYRDSKLTRLLKDSLGGNCRTVMIANISPASAQMEETLNTLKYANRAKNIKLRASRNVHSVSYHISQYNQIIQDLRSEVISLKQQLTAALQSQASSGSKQPSSMPQRCLFCGHNPNEIPPQNHQHHHHQHHQHQPSSSSSSSSYAVAASSPNSSPISSSISPVSHSASSAAAAASSSSSSHQQYVLPPHHSLSFQVPSLPHHSISSANVNGSISARGESKDHHAHSNPSGGGISSSASVSHIPQAAAARSHSMFSPYSGPVRPPGAQRAAVLKGLYGGASQQQQQPQQQQINRHQQQDEHQAAPLSHRSGAN